MRRDRHMQARLNRKKMVENAAAAATSIAPSPRITESLIVFGVSTPFRYNVIQMLQNSTAVHVYDDPDQAIDFAVENNIKIVLMDMDTPTDWRLCHDVFSNLRTFNPDIMFLLCTCDPDARPVETLAAQEAIILTKPVNSSEIYEILCAGGGGDE